MNNTNSVNDELELDGLITTFESKSVELLIDDESIAVCLNGDFAKALSSASDERLSEIFSNPQKLLVLNCSYAELSEDALSKNAAQISNSFDTLFKKCTETGKRLAVVKCPDAVKAKLTGPVATENVFFPTLLKALHSSASQIDAAAEIKIIVESAQEVFKSFFDLALTPSEIKKVQAEDTAPRSEMIGLISLSAKNAQGTLAIGFERTTLSTLTKTLFGSETDPTQEELNSTASEIMNITLGRAKQELNKRGYGIEQALPQTFNGTPDKKITANLSRPSWLIEMNSPQGIFFLEIALRISS